jgi:hypothetical protein
MRGWTHVAVGLWFFACSASDSGSSPGTAADSGPDVVLDAPGDTSGDAADGSPSDAGSDVSDASACTLSKPYSSKNAACNACVEQHCCDAVNACYADLDCDDGYVNCILACALLPDDAGDAGLAACVADCDSQYPQGKQEYEAAVGCADTQCTSECQ